MFAILIEYLLSFPKLIIEVYDAVKREVRIVFKERDGKQEEIPSRGLLILAVDYTNGAQVLFFHRAYCIDGVT